MRSAPAPAPHTHTAPCPPLPPQDLWRSSAASEGRVPVGANAQAVVHTSSWRSSCGHKHPPSLHEPTTRCSRFRADKAAGCAPKRDAGQPWRLSVRLPVPVQPGFDLLGRQAPPPLLERGFQVADESDFPGGQVQRFRAVRPLVEALLEG